MDYKVIEIFTREGSKWHHLPLADAVAKAVRDRRLAARVMVFRSVVGAFENGELVSQHVLDLSPPPTRGPASLGRPAGARDHELTRHHHPKRRARGESCPADGTERIEATPGGRSGRQA